MHQATAAGLQQHWREHLEQQRLVVSLLFCVMMCPVYSNFGIQVCLRIQHAFDHVEQEVQNDNNNGIKVSAKGLYCALSFQ